MFGWLLLTWQPLLVLAALQTPFNRPSSIQLHAFTIASDRFDLGQTHAWIHVNGLSIVAPGEIAASVHSHINAKQFGEHFMVNCTSLPMLPDIRFDFKPNDDYNHGTAILKPDEYLIRVGGNCVSPFTQLLWDVPPTSWYIAGIFLDKQSETLVAAPARNAPMHLPEPEEFVNLLGFSFGRDNVQLDHTLAVIDPQSMDIIMPVEIAGHFNIKIGAYMQDGYLQVNCDDVDTMPNLVFYIESQEKQVQITLNPGGYIIRAGGRCLSPFLGVNLPKGPSWRIGNIFLHRYKIE